MCGSHDHSSLELKVKVIGQGQCKNACVLHEYVLRHLRAVTDGRNSTFLLARLMAQYCFVRWRLSASVVCRRL